MLIEELFQVMCLYSINWKHSWELHSINENKASFSSTNTLFNYVSMTKWPSILACTQTILPLNYKNIVTQTAVLFSLNYMFLKIVFYFTCSSIFRNTCHPNVVCDYIFSYIETFKKNLLLKISVYILQEKNAN